jgi:hypothetical protein
MKWAMNIARMGEKINASRIWIRKPDRKRPQGRPRHRWEDRIKMDVRELGRGVWIGFIWLGSR